MNPEKVGIMEHHSGLVVNKGHSSYYKINVWMIKIGRKRDKERRRERGQKGRRESHVIGQYF